jgi:hypothetical protein
MGLPLKTKTEPIRASAQISAQSTSIVVCRLVVVMVDCTLFSWFRRRLLGFHQHLFDKWVSTKFAKDYRAAKGLPRTAV